MSFDSFEQISLPMSAQNGEGGKISKDIFLAVSYLQNMSFVRLFFWFQFRNKMAQYIIA